MSARLNNTVLFKREDLQPVFSFKIRGAYNHIANLMDEQKKRGVVACSVTQHAPNPRPLPRTFLCHCTALLHPPTCTTLPLSRGPAKHAKPQSTAALHVVTSTESPPPCLLSFDARAKAVRATAWI